MANPTSNFGWQMPTNTDLVKDLPADFETFGQAVDTSMADLKGGTTGQILSKNSNSDMDFVWIANDQGDITAVTAGTGISGGGTSGAVTITNSMATEITAAGDIIVGTGSGTFDNLPIGTTGQVLTADTTVSPYKVKWATAASSSGPTFSAYLNVQQYITASTWVKVQFGVEDFDTDSCYDNTTNYRFTPNKAGYYQFNYNAQVESGAQSLAALYKNGSIYHYGFKQNNNQNNHGGACIVAYANGSTDYFEVYANGSTGSPSMNWGTDRRTAFSAIWIRS